jgi:hypothetical protein
MKIQLVFNHPSRLADSSIRYEQYIAGFQELGHDAGLLTTTASAEGVNWAETVPDARSLFDPRLWARLNPDVVVVPTWLGMADLLTAIRPHVGSVLALADSDGYVGARVHPWRSLARMLIWQRSVAGKLRSAGWWIRQYLGSDQSVDEQILASCRLCDKVFVFSEGARANLLDFVRYHQAHELAARFGVAPYPVADQFESTPLAKHREDQILAVARWADPQKGAELLARTIDHFLWRCESSRVVVIGPSGERVFRRLTRAYPHRFEYRGAVPQTSVLKLFNQSRILLSTSHWESGPIVAAEAVLRGCSVVGANWIPSFRQFYDAGCGNVFATWRAPAIADALHHEADAWREGRRDPRVISDTWRGHFTPRAVCAQLLRHVSSAATDPPDNGARVLAGASEN